MGWFSRLRDRMAGLDRPTVPPVPPPPADPNAPAAPDPAPQPRWWAKYAIWAVMTAVSVGVGVLAARWGVPNPLPIPPLPGEGVVFPGGADAPVNFGWLPDPAATQQEWQQSAGRTFADTPAGQVADIPTQVFLWKGVETLTGKPAPAKDQNPTGSCVGFGTTTAIERSEASEIIHRGGDKSEFTFFSEEVTYAGSKVEGARAMGASVSRQDGSAGVFCAAWFKTYGMCPKGKYGSLDLSDYSASRARSWNTSGPPADILTVCKKYPVKDSVRVTSWEQAKKSLASGYGVSICADWCYSGPRDENGVARDLGSGWQHCMALDGYYVTPDGVEYGHIENSWSNLPDGRGNRTGQSYHTGPVGWGNPTTAGFWATKASIDRAIRQGDTYAYSGVTGFPARRLPWYAYTDSPTTPPRRPLGLGADRPVFALAH